jgi:hypothetical protein
LFDENLSLEIWGEKFFTFLLFLTFKKNIFFKIIYFLKYTQ